MRRGEMAAQPTFTKALGPNGGWHRRIETARVRNATLALETGIATRAR